MSDPAAMLAFIRTYVEEVGALGPGPATQTHDGAPTAEVEHPRRNEPSKSVRFSSAQQFPLR